MPKNSSMKPDHPDFPHGVDRGYQLGCRCDDCRAGHAAKIRDDRRKTREGISTAAHRKHAWGDTEKAVRRELKAASGANPPWIETLTLLAITLAIQIDKAAADETAKPQLLPALSAKLLVVLDRIRAATPSKPGPLGGASVGDEAEDFVNGLTKFDTP